jgi:prevent-host-death family protein
MDAASVTITELRRHAGEVIDRVIAGEHITITRHGRPVAELRPLEPTATRAAELVERWSRLPPLDSDRLRRDIDQLLDNSIEP